MTLKQVIEEALTMQDLGKQIDQAVLNNQEFTKKLSQNPDLAKAYQQEINKSSNIVNGLKNSFIELQKSMAAQQINKDNQAQSTQPTTTAQTPTQPSQPTAAPSV